MGWIFHLFKKPDELKEFPQSYSTACILLQDLRPQDTSRKAPLLEALFVLGFSPLWVDLAKQGQHGTSMSKCAGVTEKRKQLENDNQRKVKDLVPGLPAAAESLFRWPPDNPSQREGTLTYHGVYSLGFFSCQMQEQPVLNALPFPHIFSFRL